MSEVMKKIKACSYEMGDDCRCKRYKCFESVSLEERKRILKDFNNLCDYNRQNEYLGGLITIVPVKQRRNTKDDDEANFHTASYTYRVRCYVEGKLQDVHVCYKAFLAIHGISNRRVQTLKRKLTFSGVVGDDKRGKHDNRPHKLSVETKTEVFDYIKALKGRKSHYSPKDSSKVYLPEELNIKKLHRMYIYYIMSENPDNLVGYTTFREIFEQNFNISFGYPRKDTCSTCDLQKSEISLLERQIATCTEIETIMRLKKRS
ncbi:uncharacterized protein LOC123318356 [Coccinella septempunctata]|uniref:uncharacterized protein LOC123318356 n=1 Tax=Coccinella septempunctata TaxID=41139 RepID=UPI001D08D1A2|nr:uncharacterized protein LOC123318356 [Coccinella septempunctata]